MRGALGIAVVIALGGCTAILNLDKVASVDRDNDGIPDATDNCPDDANPDQSDFDHNGKGDACDLCTDGGSEDVDHDGIPDGCDGCIGNGMDVDHDGIDDGCDPCIGNGMDVDHDGIDDACDSCIGNGMDLDHDGIDDACDSCVQTFMDMDNDMIDDGCDPCVAAPHGIDDDGDGIENACDPCPSGPQHDEDGDGAYDACDTCKVVKDVMQNDLDNDGVGNKCDPEAGINDYERMDPFAVLDPSWFESGAAWTIQNDNAVLPSGGVGISYRWLSPLRSKATIETRVQYNPTIPTFGSPAVGVIAFDATSSSAAHQLWCIVDATGMLTGKIVVNGTGTSVVGKTVNPTQHIVITMAIDDTTKSVTCTADDGATNATVVLSLNDYGVLWFPGLMVQATTATFSYFDQIGRLP